VKISPNGVQPVNKIQRCINHVSPTVWNVFTLKLQSRMRIIFLLSW